MTEFKNSKLEDADAWLEYRRKLAESLRRAKSYRGSEIDFKRVISTISDLEVWMAQTFKNGERLSDAEERLVAEKFGKNPDITVNDLLTITGESLKRVLDSKDHLKGLNVTVIKLEGTVLPPGKGKIKEGDGSGVIDKKTQPRLQELIALLNENKIFTDDIVVCESKNTPEMMREEPYYIVEIPKLNREILVCNEVGQATFVIDGIFARETLCEIDKEELQKKYKDKVRRIEYRSKSVWEKELQESLFKDGNIGLKVDVKDREAVRNAIMERFKAEDFLASFTRKKGESSSLTNIKIGSMGLTAIARVFGLDGNASHKLVFLELAARIYGEDHPQISELLTTERELKELSNDPAKWRDEVKNLVPDSKDWVNMTYPAKVKLKVKSKGLNGLAYIFGVNGNPIENKMVFLELGEKIYSPEDSNIKTALSEARENMEKQKELGTNKNKWRTEIIKKYPYEIWKKLEQHERSKVRVWGFGPIELARIFEASDPTYVEGNIKFMKGVYGETDDQVTLELLTKDEVLKLTRDPDSLKEEILKKFTPEGWVSIGTEQRRQIKIKGEIGLIQVARTFGLEGNPLRRNIDHLRIAEKIFGPDNETIKKAIEKELSK